MGGGWLARHGTSIAIPTDSAPKGDIRRMVRMAPRNPCRDHLSLARTSCGHVSRWVRLAVGNQWVCGTIRNPQPRLPGRLRCCPTSKTNTRPPPNAVQAEPKHMQRCQSAKAWCQHSFRARIWRTMSKWTSWGRLTMVCSCCGKSANR